VGIAPVTGSGVINIGKMEYIWVKEIGRGGEKGGKCIPTP